MMERHEKLLKRVNFHGLGLEIGPSYAPTTPKSKGWNCHVLDHMDAAGLKIKYGPEVPIFNVEEVDFVWSGQPYKELVGENRYDYIIASHVIEHVPNLIGFLEDCRSILKPGGVLSLAVPDMRYCFDCLRSLSEIGTVIDAHLADLKSTSPGRVYDYFSKAVLRNGAHLWSDETLDGLAFMVRPDFARFAFSQSLQGLHAYDVHCWTFTPSSFRLIIQTLSNLGFVGLREVEFFDSSDGEFFLTLSETAEAANQDEMVLLKQIRAELASAFTAGA
jgi:SAM-dependent methyltransferase